MQKQPEPYHQISHSSSERDTYLLHPASSVTQCDTTKRRVSMDSPLYDHMPATPYSSEPPTPSYHPSSYPSSSNYLAPSPSSILMNSDPFSGTRSSIPLEHYPPTPYSDDLHSPNSEHSGYASPQVNNSSSYEISSEAENGQLSCLEGYESQRNGGGQDQQIDHSSSFGAREQVGSVQSSVYVFVNLPSFNMVFIMFVEIILKHEPWTVVFFDQHLGAAHSKHWSKYAFQCFSHKKQKKQEN